MRVPALDFGYGRSPVALRLPFQPALSYRPGSFLERTTVPGRSYRLEYNNALSNPAWTPLSSNLPATGTSLSTTLNFAAPSHRFFQILQTD
jgi:hypothetical protein